MRYLIKATYTPTDPESDRRRKGVVVESGSGVLDAITAALSLLEMAGLHDDVIGEYLSDIGDEDTSEGWAWEVPTNNGEWHFEWEPFDSDDPVTNESLLAWANTTAGDESTLDFLHGILYRWTWRSLEWQKESDLREQLYELMTEGTECKPTCQQNIDEAIAEIMGEVVEAQRDNYDEVGKNKPFGLAVMVEDDPALWLGDS